MTSKRTSAARKARGAVAQIRPQETGEPVIITFQSDGGQREDLMQALALERNALPTSAGPRAMTLSKVVRYVVGLGLDLYWALDATQLTLEALVSATGAQSRREALKQALELAKNRKR